MATTSSFGVVLDTDLASRLMRGSLPYQLERRLFGRLRIVTFVTLAEAIRGAHMARWSRQQFLDLDEFYGSFDRLPWHDAIPGEYGRLSGMAARTGRTIPQNDCWIAATCVKYGLPLMTLNRRDFEPLRRLGLVLL